MADNDTKEVNKEQVKDGGSEGSGVENARTEAFTDASSNQKIEEMNSSKGTMPEGFGNLTLEDKGASGSGKQGTQKQDGADSTKKDEQSPSGKDGQPTKEAADPSTKDTQPGKPETGDPSAKDGQPTRIGENPATNTRPGQQEGDSSAKDSEPTKEAADPSTKDTQPGKPVTGDPSAKDGQPTREGDNPSAKDAQPAGHESTDSSKDGQTGNTRGIRVTESPADSAKKSPAANPLGESATKEASDSAKKESTQESSDSAKKADLSADVAMKDAEKNESGKDSASKTPEEKLKDSVSTKLLEHLNVKNPEQHIKDMSKAAEDIMAAKPEDRAKVFGDAADKFVKDNPNANPHAFGDTLNEAFRNSEAGKGMHVSTGAPHADLKDISAISKDNPGGVVAEKFVGMGNPERNKELKTAIETADKMKAAAEDPKLDAKQLETELNKHLKDASEKALAESKGKDKTETLVQLARDVHSELFRKGQEMPELGGKRSPIDLVQDKSGKLSLKMSTEVSGADLKFKVRK